MSVVFIRNTLSIVEYCVLFLFTFFFFLRDGLFHFLLCWSSRVSRPQKHERYTHTFRHFLWKEKHECVKDSILFSGVRQFCFFYYFSDTKQRQTFGKRNHHKHSHNANLGVWERVAWTRHFWYVKARRVRGAAHEFSKKIKGDVTCPTFFVMVVWWKSRQTEGHLRMIFISLYVSHWMTLWLVLSSRPSSAIGSGGLR